MKVYLLSHLHRLEEWNIFDYKFIWLFSSESKAKNVIAFKSENESGFMDAPNSFVIKSFDVVGSENQDVLSTLFILQLALPYGKNVFYENVEDIGVYATRLLAEEWAKKYALEHGVAETMLSIDEKTVDFAWWKGWFETID